jgi:O-antigen ligase
VRLSSELGIHSLPRHGVRMTAFFTDQRVAIPLAVGIVVVAFLAARQISAIARWRPAGPLVLLAATPLVPNIVIGLHLSTDDVLPLVGLGLLVWQGPLPSWPRSRLFQIALIAVFLATVARVLSAIANGTDLGDSFAMLVEAVGRPVLLVAIAAYIATAQPPGRRRDLVATAIGVVGSLEAAFGLIAYLVPLPSHIGINPIATWKETLGGCGARITGTLGLGANHIGALFVVTIAVSAGLAIKHEGRWRWIWAGATAAQGAALVLTFTRTSIILAALAFLALMVYHRQVRLLLITTAISAALLLGVMSVACQPKSGAPPPGPGSGVGVIRAITDRFGDSTDRAALWYSSTLVMLDHPLFGVGLGKIKEAISSNPSRYVHTPFGAATSSSHNTILLAGAETGVLGALAMLVLNVVLGLAALVWIVRGRRNPLISAAGFAVGAFLAQGMLNNLFTVGVTGVLLALMVGAFASALGDELDPERQTITT